MMNWTERSARMKRFALVQELSLSKHASQELGCVTLEFEPKLTIAERIVAAMHDHKMRVEHVVL